MPLDISTLITPVTSDEVMSSILSVAATLGLSTTSWQSGQPSRTILLLVSDAIASTLSITSTITRGGLLDLASSVTPEGGPGWLDALVASGWSATRRAATYATCDVTLTTGAACPGGVYAAGTFHVSRGSIGYSNVSSLTVPAGAGSVSGAFVADVAGSTGSSGVGTITTVVTTIVGVTCSNSTAAVGADAETNAELVTRCKAKWSSISVDGPSGAYTYNALTINEENQVQVTSGARTEPQLPTWRTPRAPTPRPRTTRATSPSRSHRAPMRPPSRSPWARRTGTRPRTPSTSRVTL
jgi:Baseplate J-like protein